MDYSFPVGVGALFLLFWLWHTWSCIRASNGPRERAFQIRTTFLTAGLMGAVFAEAMFFPDLSARASIPLYFLILGISLLSLPLFLFLSIVLYRHRVRTLKIIRREDYEQE